MSLSRQNTPKSDDTSSRPDLRKTSAASSGKSARIATKLARPFSLPNCRPRAGTGRSGIPPSPRVERPTDCRSVKAQRIYAGLHMFACLECARPGRSGPARDHWIHNPKGQRSKNATEPALARPSSTSSVASAQPVARGNLRNRHRNFPEEDFWPASLGVHPGHYCRFARYSLRIRAECPLCRCKR